MKLNGDSGHKLFSCVLGVLPSQKTINTLLVIRRKEIKLKISSNILWINLEAKKNWASLKGFILDQTTLWTVHLESCVISPFQYNGFIQWFKNFFLRLKPWTSRIVDAIVSSWSVFNRAVVFGFHENNWQVRIFMQLC